MVAQARVPLEDRLALLEPLTSTDLDLKAVCRLSLEWLGEAFPGTKGRLHIEHAGEVAEHWELMIDGSTASATYPTKTVNADAWVQFPIEHEGRQFGTLELVLEPRSLLGRGPQLVHRLTNQLGRVIGWARRLADAEVLASRDELTGLGNRRQMVQMLAGLLDAARRDRTPLSVLLFDVDHFKRFNDTWGHAIGDRVLQMVAELMRKVFRTDDVVCRYGGEEFAVILKGQRAPNADSDVPEPLDFAERLRQEAERLQLHADDGSMLAKITLSGGIATFPWDAGSADGMLRAADAALYAAKRAGRNRICLAEPQPLGK